MDTPKESLNTPSKSSYKQLIVWQKSLELVDKVYAIVKTLPREEQYILCSQMLRSAISIPSNIAEGWSRNRRLEFMRYLEIAYGSSSELETQLIIARRQYQIEHLQVMQALEEVQKMLAVFIKKLKNQQPS